MLFRNGTWSDRRGKAGAVICSHVHFKKVPLVVTGAFFIGQGFGVRDGTSGRGKRC